MKILALAGSARETSVNKRLLLEVERRLATSGHEVTVRSLADFDLPLYSGDVEAESGAPESAERFRQMLADHDALVIASPEYNFSMPGILKNLIDWVSRFRPFPFKNVPTLLMSASPSALGGNRGLWALRIPLEALGALVHPEMYSLPRTKETFDGDEIVDEKLSGRLDFALEEFLRYADALT